MGLEFGTREGDIMDEQVVGLSMRLAEAGRPKYRCGYLRQAERYPNAQSRSRIAESS